MAKHFEICAEMARRNLDIRLSLLENVSNLQYSARMRGTKVTIGIDGNLIAPIFNGDFVGGLLLCKKEQYFAIADELDREIPGGFLEVGCTEAKEIVINHPDLKPDEKGVGHIVFSLDQARAFVKTIKKQIEIAEG